MKQSIAISSFLLVFLLACIPCTFASEYPQSNNYATKEEVQRGDNDVIEKVSDLRESFTSGWLRTSSIILSSFSVLLSCVIIIIGFGTYISVTRIRAMEEEAERLSEVAKTHAESAKDSAEQAEIHKQKIQAEANILESLKESSS